MYRPSTVRSKFCGAKIDRSSISWYDERKKGGTAMTKEYFKDWNYKKHAKFVTAVYLGLYAIDMTASYFLLKKLLK